MGILFTLTNLSHKIADKIRLLALPEDRLQISPERALDLGELRNKSP